MVIGKYKEYLADLKDPKPNGGFVHTVCGHSIPLWPTRALLLPSLADTRLVDSLDRHHQRSYPPAVSRRSIIAVTGIGGVFFRADDPGALAKLYEQHLGPTTGPLLWMREEGPTVFALPTMSRPIGIREEMAKVGGL